jgi:hypothetical protein
LFLTVLNSYKAKHNKSTGSELITSTKKIQNEENKLGMASGWMIREDD